MKHVSASAALCASVLAGLTGMAHAGQAANDAATHFQAIGSADLAVPMRGYDDAARLQWLGGPLDGSYAGSAAVRGVWEKLGKAPIKVRYVPVYRDDLIVSETYPPRRPASFHLAPKAPS